MHAHARDRRGHVGRCTLTAHVRVAPLRSSTTTTATDAGMDDTLNCVLVIGCVCVKCLCYVLREPHK